MNARRYTRTIVQLVVLALVSIVMHAVNAGDRSTPSKNKQTRLGLYMTAEEAYRYTVDNRKKTLFIDVRTPSELNYLGTVSVIDAHVPLVFMDTTAWNDRKHRYQRAKNPSFVSDVDAALEEKGLDKNDTVILMCRSGSRSARAVNLLAEAGYTRVYNMVDGYEGSKAKDGPDEGKRVINGWKNAGLPWTYSLDKDYMYFTQ